MGDCNTDPRRGVSLDMGRLFLASLLLIASTLPGTAWAEPTQADTTPTNAPVAAAVAPIRRLIQVDSDLYRGGQPDEAGFRYLRDVVGVDTVLSLRNDITEQAVVESLGMRFISIPMTYRPLMLGAAPTADAVERFFKVVDDHSLGTVFFHCKRGADRTGTFAALYRVARQGWSLDRAYDEARDIGMRWWYFPVKSRMARLIPDIPAAD